MIRVISGIVGFSLPLAGAIVALIVSGVEPERGVPLPFFVSLTGQGLLLGVGLMLFAGISRHLLNGYKAVRFFCGALLLVPIIPAFYFLKVTGSYFMVAYCLLVLMVTVTCLFELVAMHNKSRNPTATPPVR